MEPTPSPRDAGDDPSMRPRSPIGDRWAVIVGISEYADPQLTLRYAHRDAQALYDFLLTPAGGAFAPERMRLLLDAEATTRSLVRAVRSFLAATKKDDLVLIFVACHGAPDDTAPGKPLYVLTHDTEMDDLAGSAWPMDDLAWCLRNYVLAQRIIILADTCHSAGMATGARGSDLSAAVLNRYLDQLSTSTPGIAYLTSATEAQRSYEDDQWGGGHGAFTWFLLQGLRGEADGYGGRPKDGVVSLDELAAFVGDQVYKETGRRQRPVLGAGRYDRELPLAVAGGLDVEHHQSLAQALLDVGWLMDDPAPFLCAAREAWNAIELAGLTGATLPAAHELAGEALLAGRAYREAVELLTPAIERFGDDLPPRSRLHLGLAHAALREPAAAAGFLEDFVSRDPASSDAPWASEYAAWLRADLGGAVWALLIGASKVEMQAVAPLAGPANDVVLLRELLSSRLGVPSDHITSLVDEQATRDAVLEALGWLARSSTDRDTVIVHFSGRSLPVAEADDVFLFTYDAPGGQLAGITPVELHQLVAAIPARGRLLILDVQGSEAFARALASDPVATALVGAAPDSFAYEEISGEKTHGAFTAAVAKVWADAAASGDALKAGDVVRKTAPALQGKFGQRPVVLGDPAAALPRGGTFVAAELWRFDRLRAPAPVPKSLVKACREARWPNGRRATARDLAAQGKFAEMARILRKVASDGDPWAWLDSAEADVLAQRSSRALEALTKVDHARALDWSNAAKASAAEAIGALRDARPRSLLIGIETYQDATLSPVPGAIEDVAAFRELLASFGFAAADISELHDSEATREHILDELAQLCRHAADELAVLYVAANGSRATTGAPTLVPYDGRGGGSEDLTLAELANMARSSAALNLVTVIDAGCGYDSVAPHARAATTVPAAAGTPRQFHAARMLADTAASPALPLDPIGAVTVMAALPEPGSGDAIERVRVAGDGRPRGVLTEALIAAANRGHSGLLYQTWATRAARRSKLRIAALGAAATEPVFRHRTRQEHAMTELAAISRAPARAAADLAKRLAARFDERREPSPATHLELGIALVAADRPVEAIASLRLARNLYEDPNVRAAQESRDPRIEVWSRETCYHLGNLLYAQAQGPEDLTEAVTALRYAHRRARNDPRICLHLALAIRKLVERQSLNEVTELLEAYLDAGAPLGRADEIQAYLKTREQLR